MIKFQSRQILFLFFSLVFFFNLEAQEPDWVKSPPVLREYYVGIGASKKIGNSSEYADAAKNEALRSLASEITVNISGEFITQLAEKSGLVEQEIKSSVQATTKAQLEGYELVDTYDDGGTYWVYYRLSKEEYARRKVNKLKKATSASLDFFKKARNVEANNHPGKAIALYLQSIIPIQQHLDDPLDVELDGNKIYLMNEIYSSLSGLFGGISFSALNSPESGKVGMPVKAPLKLKVTYNQSTPVAQLPISFHFLRGAGQLIESMTTNSNGEALCKISKITATDKLQMVRAEIDKKKLLPSQISPVVVGMLKNLGLPGVNFIINVRGISVYLTVEEQHLGSQGNMLYIEPKLKNILSGKGFNFTQNPAEADIMIDLKAASRKGAEFSGMFSAFVDMNISVTDMTSGAEVYKASKTGIKGIQLDYDKAGVKAFENASKSLEKLIDEMVTKIQK